MQGFHHVFSFSTTTTDSGLRHVRTILREMGHLPLERSSAYRAWLPSLQRAYSLSAPLLIFGAHLEHYALFSSMKITQDVHEYATPT
jgi:hypothetical protein